MSNIRLFFKESLSLNLTAKLDKSQSHYANKVMRVKVGEVFSLFNDSGEWEAKILNISKSIVEFNITKQLRQKENTKELWLAFSPIKSNYFNFMIQKATELGVTKFLPIIFDAYGTLFDVNSAAEKCKDKIGDKWEGFANYWRTTQLEYTWLRSLMNRHKDFWQVTELSLIHI